MTEDEELQAWLDAQGPQIDEEHKREMDRLRKAKAKPLMVQFAELREQLKIRSFAKAIGVTYDIGY